MVKSMTGYGRHESVGTTRKISVELRSVNHRYSDINIKVPRMFSFLEEYVRGYIADRVSRGKIDVYISIENYGDEAKCVKVDEALAAEYVEGIRSLAEKFGLANDVTAGSLARFPDLFIIEKKEEDKETIWAEVKLVFDVAIEGFSSMRVREGDRISAFLIDRAQAINTMVSKVEQQAPKTVAAYEIKLKDRIAELLGDNTIDESRVLTEVAIFADRVSIDEEIERLKSHLVEFKNILESGEPAGRKLDFLIQEMNREINTIGSKGNDIEISRCVVEAKSEIEKLREQIQNIE